MKDELTKDIQRDAAGDAVAKTANDIDDAMAGGSTFEQVAQKFGLVVCDASKRGEMTAVGR